MMAAILTILLFTGWTLYIREKIRIRKPNKIHIRWRDNGDIHISTQRQTIPDFLTINVYENAERHGLNGKTNNQKAWT